ncbi:Pregnancy-associated plasma protein-A [Nocardioides terrae]|uniref:Pregnancy-associated plasma protein-A n=1 Tax=Nocardioides terrae TaxID=574651 RepID=A0A1I1GB76_9ACTN|nr:zinc metalloprotease [Nocardioides terrae]SFC08785.1 Pregnancy-associated plasma protein-A [Nocardioides terrae]
MPLSRHLTSLAAGAVAAGALLAVAPSGTATAARPEAAGCQVNESGTPAFAARGGTGGDTRAVSAAEQKRIQADLEKRLAAKKGATAASSGRIGATVPVYFHVMLSASGAGDVTQSQIDQQISVLNRDYAGGKSSTAADLGVTFTLAGVDRYKNNSWHQDKQSSTYRRQTRLGGKNALNVWLVDFSYLGIATFPWDYARQGAIDGIRVQYSSLPGGSIANYNLGETASHEAGHWFGLYHTFQGGCTATNDEVTDTPAQSSATSGCPAGRDSCSLPGLDPIHNFMDYSYDSCYLEFTQGQADRASQMWAAYRA